MTTPAAQAKAQALNAKMEGEARIMLDEIDKQVVRKVARSSTECTLQCYKTAGSTGPSDVLEQCLRQCQAPHQQAHNYVQQEVAQFQNRLNRGMQDCQDKARDLMVPGYEQDARKMQKVEDALIGCMGKTVDEHIRMLQPMKKRIVGQLK